MHAYLKPKDIEYCNGGVLSLLVSDVIDTGHQPGEQPSIESLCQGVSVGEVSMWRKRDKSRGRRGRKENKIEVGQGKRLHTSRYVLYIPCVQSLANIERRVEHFTSRHLQKICTYRNFMSWQSMAIYVAVSLIPRPLSPKAPLLKGGPGDEAM